MALISPLAAHAKFNPGKAIKNAGKSVGGAVAAAAKAVAQPVVVPVKVAVETAKVITGNESPEQAAKVVKDEIVKIPVKAGEAVNSTATAAQNLSNLPIDAAKAGLASVAGKPGEIVGDALTVGQRATSEVGVTIAKGVGNLLQGHDPLEANPATLALAAAIESARDQHQQEAKPVPEPVRAALSPLVPGPILNKAKYTVGFTKLSLPDAINTCQTEIGSAKAHAVTVDYIIVFSDEPKLTISGLSWWAHELHHVAQYDKFGVQTFAQKYIKSSSALENEARAKEEEAVKYLRANTNLKP